MHQLKVLLFLSPVFVFGVPASGYQLLGAEWDPETGPVRYAIDEAGSDDVSDGSDIQAVINAFDRWTCIEDSALRSQNIPVLRDDNGAVIFMNVRWDETGDAMLGPGTLGVGGSNGIIFNGFDSTWTTDPAGAGGLIDIESIAVHEAGHMLGLGHSCNDEAETDCLPASESVMNPGYPGGDARALQQDDVDGFLAMYEKTDPDDNSTCDGPFRIGEFCSCDDDCVGDLTCVGQIDGSQKCSRGCSSDDLNACGPGLNCVLAEKPDDDTPAPGTCLSPVINEFAPPATACSGQGFICGDLSCARSGATDAEVCFQGCQADEDCLDGYLCTGVLCVLDPSRISIPCGNTNDDDDNDDVADEVEDGCACDGTRPASDAALFAGFLFLQSRRRRK